MVVVWYWYGGYKVNDRQKLEFVFWHEDVKLTHCEDGFIAAGRRYYFNAASELVKIEEA